MPTLASVQALIQAAADFEVADLDLVLQPAAVATARRSLAESGLLLLGEMHGVRQNPLLARALMQALGLTRLALEWPVQLSPVLGDFLATGTLADHPLLWPGDGRITAGHFAVLAERAADGPLEVILFDVEVGAGRSWSQRDEAMARCLLAAAPARSRTLAVAGNAHTPTSPTSLGTPMGVLLARQRPGAREIFINYCSGSYYNLRTHRFRARGSPPRQIGLRQHHGTLVLDLPVADEAIVPHRAVTSGPAG